MSINESSTATNNIVTNNILPFRVITNNDTKDKVKYNKDGSIKMTKCNKVAGKSSEVYAFRTKEEINAIIDVLNKHIITAFTENQRQIAYRNKLLFIIGINVGLRGSDLRTLKWSFFFKRGEKRELVFKPSYVIQPIKQRKQRKFVKLFFNNAVKNVIEEYTKEYPVINLNDYLFASRKGDEPIAVASLWRIIKEIAEEAGIEQNIGSHSLRKTWGYFCFHEAEDKNKALVILQKCFGHSSTQVTMHYIGLMDSEIEEMYYSINLGLEM